jgi:hypothetical protein
MTRAQASRHVERHRSASARVDYVAIAIVVAVFVGFISYGMGCFR